MKGPRFSIWVNIFVVVAFFTPAHAETLQGVPNIVDGDTVDIGATRIRLLGLDAPESDQICLDAKNASWTCGIAAREALKEKSAGRLWTCDLRKKPDRWGRRLGTCFVDGENIEQWMVRQGWALSAVKYKPHPYDQDEISARDECKNLWAGAFIRPWAWRYRGLKTEVLSCRAVPIDAPKRFEGIATDAPSPECNIKGNVKRDECIYHLPGGGSYGKLNMSKAGRRWFCSEADAQAAGCRKAVR